MARSVAGVIAIAAIVLVTACGGSGEKSRGSGSTGGSNAAVSTTSGAVVTAKDRGFTVITPAGFSHRPSVIQYLAAGPVVTGFSTSIMVLRQSVRKGDVSTVADKTLSAVRHAPNARSVSPLRSLSVDGEPALRVDFGVQEGGRKAHQVSLVFVRHGEWIYYLRGFAPPNVLTELIRSWHWL